MTDSGTDELQYLSSDCAAETHMKMICKSQEKNICCGQSYMLAQRAVHECFCSYIHNRLKLRQPEYPQLGVVLLWLHLFIISGVISPLISSSILGTYQPGEFIFQCPIFLPFYAVHGFLKAGILKWFAFLFSCCCC